MNLEKDEMDGGETVVEGLGRCRMILDQVGRFKEFRPLKGRAAAAVAGGAGSMDDATARVLKRMEDAASRTEAAADRAEKAAAGGGKGKKPEREDAGGAGGQGFVAPS